MKKRIVLYADSGKVLTNGTVYGEIIYLADASTKKNYYEITKEEYQSILAEQEAAEVRG